jgi:hypothetical protein
LVGWPSASRVQREAPSRLDQRRLAWTSAVSLGPAPSRLDQRRLAWTSAGSRFQRRVAGPSVHGTFGSFGLGSWSTWSAPSDVGPQLDGLVHERGPIWPPPVATPWSRRSMRGPRWRLVRGPRRTWRVKDGHACRCFPRADQHRFGGGPAAGVFRGPRLWSTVRGQRGAGPRPGPSDGWPQAASARTWHRAGRRLHCALPPCSPWSKHQTARLSRRQLPRAAVTATASDAVAVSCARWLLARFDLCPRSSCAAIAATASSRDPTLCCIQEGLRSAARRGADVRRVRRNRCRASEVSHL